MGLGGSLVVPDKIDVDYLRDFRAFLLDFLTSNEEQRFVLVIGGGSPARAYQAALKTVYPEVSDDELDWTGIFATRLNARMVKAALGDYCIEPVVEDPSSIRRFSGRVLVAAGWKPGFSTDFDAVILAEGLQANTVINMTDIDQIYTDDPKTNPSAQPIGRITWSEYTRIIGSEWIPGKNAPFDPVATKRASEIGLTVISAHGKKLVNLKQILTGADYVGTTIVPG